MGIRVGNFKLVYESITMEAIYPEYLGIIREQIVEHIKNHPYPDDPNYPKEFMIGGITKSSGFYSLPKDIKDETADWIADMLNTLI